MEELRALRKKQKQPNLHARLYKKVTVLIMLHQGHSINLVESALGLDDNTIRRYVNKYLSNRDVEDYLTDGYLSYSGKLTPEQESHLTAHLEQYLYPESKSICHYVQEQFGVAYTPSGMVDLLHRLGFVYKQSKAVASKADDAAQVAFLSERLESLLKQVADGEAVVYYSDACHPTHNTKTSRGWIRRGQTFEIDCNSGRKRVNINAAINAIKPEHLVYDVATTINAASTQRLCRQLLKKHPRKKIYLICDNAPYNRNKELIKWVYGQRIELVYLPTYSPNLNLIERLWRLLRAEAINSIYYQTYQEFKEAIVKFLEGIKYYKSELRSLLSLNFRTVGGNSFYAQTNS